MNTNKWNYPPITLLHNTTVSIPENIIPDNIKAIQSVLDSFKVNAKVVKAYKTPQYIKYYIEPGSGVHTDEIRHLTHEFARAVSSVTGSVYVTPCEPGTPYIGIDIPLEKPTVIPYKQIIASNEMTSHASKLAVPLGVSAPNTIEIADLKDLTHVMIGGTTGSGKSVLTNTWICSLFMRTTPEEVRLILIDPKRVEYVDYNGMPHLLNSVLVDTKEAIDTLSWVHEEMERRYKTFAQLGVRNIDAHNDLPNFQALPYIVIFIDEFSDLMAYDGKTVEQIVVDLAQMARATGIHLVISTSRPSQEVYTDNIKVNIPTRIAFNVSSREDSQKIIDAPGAEYLLGSGDMLIQLPGEAKVKRIQGALITENEVHEVVNYVKQHNP